MIDPDKKEEPWQSTWDPEQIKKARKVVIDALGDRCRKIKLRAASIMLDDHNRK